jgi:acyl carrier protein
MKSMEEIRNELIPIIAEVLAIEPEEVTSTARFFEDLGGESIDILELSFQAGRHFGVKVPIQELAASEEWVTDEQGRLTDAALTSMKERYPFLDYSGFEDDPSRSRMTRLITVDAIAGLIRAALEEREKTQAEAHSPAPADPRPA